MTNALSHVTGLSSPPLLTDSIGRHLEIACRRWADRLLLISRHQSIRKSYGEFGADVMRLAAGFNAAGLHPGDRLALWSRNRYEWVLAQMAAARAGLIFVGLNPAYRGGELEYALDKAGCKALIVSDPSKGEDFTSILRAVVPEIDREAPERLRPARLPRLQLVWTLGETALRGAMRFRELIETEMSNESAPQVHPDAPAAIQFTSGTTGAAKAATLSHANLLNNGFFVGETLRLDEHDRVCVPVQLYHSFGTVAGILAAITHGAAVILSDERFAPGPTLHALADEKCTAVIGVPTMYLAMLEHDEIARADLSSLRTGIMSCSPCPTEIMRRAVATMHLSEITIAYGMTETSPVSFQSAPDDPLERRVDTVGHVHPHLAAKVVDKGGRTLPLGIPGELLVRGYSVMLGYWGDPVATREAVDAEGWMHTGDLATLDADGYCRIVGRLKDIIIRAGENVAPQEIEEALHRHPKVAEACVFGVPDTRFGEEICAWIRLREPASATAREIRAFCRDRLANFKVPRYIKFVDAFPLTVTGKVQRFAMREETLAELKTNALRRRPIRAAQ
ncbi:MAG TPA: AMP-binding protein [Stellaceae bacterium]|nr:AMP-binding protein [Stellaceae bacterium]